MSEKQQDQAELAASEWWAGFERVCALVEQAQADDPGLLERPVPATPDWTARDLLAHMVGLGHDTLDGDEPDDHNPGWTQAQVDARAERSATEILQEWREDAPALRTYLLETSPRPLGDLLIHEQDLRGALSAPGARDTAGLALVRATMASRLADAVAGLDAGPLRLEQDDAPSPGEAWTWQSQDGEPGAVLRASGFDLFRTVTTRRTAEQLNGYVVAGDVEPYLGVLAAMGDLPKDPLPE